MAFDDNLEEVAIVQGSPYRDFSAAPILAEVTGRRLDFRNKDIENMKLSQYQAPPS